MRVGANIFVEDVVREGQAVPALPEFGALNGAVISDEMIGKITEERTKNLKQMWIEYQRPRVQGMCMDAISKRYPGLEFSCGRKVITFQDLMEHMDSEPLSATYLGVAYFTTVGMWGNGGWAYWSIGGSWIGFFSDQVHR